MKTNLPLLGLLALALSTLVALSGCASVPVVIATDLDSAALVQRAQEAADASKYEVAMQYYQALVDRYGADPANRIAGQYEIAFLEYKMGKTAKAKELFEAVLAAYGGPGAEAFPPRYKILAEKLLAKLK
jgi:outer membrane protein assembly factor BamD (BamD/ComL family)